MKRTPLARKPIRHRSTFTTPVPNEPCYCGCGRRATQRHHIIDAQVLARHGAPTDDERVLAPVFHDCHLNHHAFSRRLPRPGPEHPVWVFAEEHGLVWWMERYYPVPEREAA